MCRDSLDNALAGQGHFEHIGCCSHIEVSAMNLLLKGVIQNVPRTACAWRQMRRTFIHKNKCVVITSDCVRYGERFRVDVSQGGGGLGLFPNGNRSKIQLLWFNLKRR